MYVVTLSGARSGGGSIRQVFSDDPNATNRLDERFMTGIGALFARAEIRLRTCHMGHSM